MASPVRHVTALLSNNRQNEGQKTTSQQQQQQQHQQQRHQEQQRHKCEGLSFASDRMPQHQSHRQPNCQRQDEQQQQQQHEAGFVQNQKQQQQQQRTRRGTTIVSVGSSSSSSSSSTTTTRNKSWSLLLFVSIRSLLVRCIVATIQMMAMYSTNDWTLLPMATATTTKTTAAVCINGAKYDETLQQCRLIEQQQQHQHQPECHLYMAESTIPGAGLGIFTTIEKHVGDVVGYGDVCIPVVDMYWHNGFDIQHAFRSYFWSGESMGMVSESDTDDMEAICPGLDCAINCHLGLINVAKSIPMYQEAALHRSQDPGAGAFTPYHNGTTTVSRDIPAGGELFKNYGDNWFLTRPVQFHKVPLLDDYTAAQKLIVKLFDMPLANREIDTDAAVNALEDLYELIRGGINNGVFRSRTLNALPATLADAVVAYEAEEIAATLQPHAIRSVDWLQQHGACIDHIRPGRSHITQAGHGAFATRDLPAGITITSSPLHHVANFDFMNMYNLTVLGNDDSSSNSNSNNNNHRRYARLVDHVVHWQLLLNYCFGHVESTLLLCPYGAGINYINHAPTPEQVNVRIQWPTHHVVDDDDADNDNNNSSNNKHVHPMAIVHRYDLVENGTIEDDLITTIKPVLAFDYVATKDIAAGDELYLDYGDVWHHAWEEHVQYWQPYDPIRDPVGSPLDRTTWTTPKHYASARYWNYHFAHQPLRTQTEQVVDPYPAHLSIKCHRGLLLNQWGSHAPPTTTAQTQFIWKLSDIGIPCRIVDRFVDMDVNGADPLYTVILEIQPEDYDDDNDNDDDDDNNMTNSRNKKKIKTKWIRWMERTDVPRSAMQFFDQPKTTDLHLPNTFRHAIGIPDDMFPPQWKNIALASSETTTYADSEEVEELEEEEEEFDTSTDVSDDEYGDIDNVEDDDDDDGINNNGEL